MLRIKNSYDGLAAVHTGTNPLCVKRCAEMRTNMDNLVITVARGFGSCGKRIAKQIADDLGIHCYENRILMLASQMSGLDEEVFAEVNEKLRNQNVFFGIS